MAVGSLGVPAAEAQVVSHPAVVSADPANWTPHVLDGSVKSIVQVGDTVIVGGQFTKVQAAAGGPVLTRNNVVAFNATTGAISTTFVPNPDGEVTTVLAAADGQSVYLGGLFRAVNGTSLRSLAQVSLSNGALTAFRPALNSRVRDLRLVGNRLWVAGSFGYVGGLQQSGLATVNPTTGAFDRYMTLRFDGPRNGGVLQVSKIDVTPDGGRLAAIGNFSTVDGASRPQLAMLDLTGGTARLADWATPTYGAECNPAFDSYMRDLDFSPDGSYFVITTTGSYYGGPPRPCDTTMRWETSALGESVTPTWVNYTGGDTLYAVEITGSAVYVGGHFRWQNNPHAGDSAGPGAVAREGIATLDPVNGLPLTWNPGRTKGVGVFDMLATPAGLWVGSDTDRIGNWEYHGRIAFFPLAGGTPLPPATTGSLPGHVFLAGGQPSGTAPGSVLYRVNAGGDALPSADGGPDWAGDRSRPDPHHSAGSNTAAYGPVGGIDSSVPATTPSAVFDSERWDPAGSPAMAWDFPVASGTPLQVRLYFASRCSCTSTVGSRVFDVRLDGRLVADDFDIVGTAGQNVGTMQAFTVTSDGNVDIDFDHVVENPLINGIEIVRTDVAATTPPGGADDLRDVWFDGQRGQSATLVSDTGIPWGSSRGSVMIDGSVYTGWSDGSFTRRTFDGRTFGPPVPVDGADKLVTLGEWRTDVARMTGLFFDRGRLYYTVAGSSQLYYRYFTPESDVVGSLRYTASPSVAGVDLSKVSGMFLVGGKLYFGSGRDGDLRWVDWADGAPVADTVAVVGGPALDGNDWRARSMFVYTGNNLPGPNQPPVATASVDCAGLTCTADGTRSSDPEGTIPDGNYAWDFGDGGTATGATASHTYGAAGTYTVALTVTDGVGATATDTTTVTVAPQPATPVSHVGASSATANASSFAVTVPPVASGDALVLVATTATTVTVNEPTGVTGWTQVATVPMGGANGTTTVWQKVAAAGDAGQKVHVSLSALAKADVSLVAYTGTSTTAPVSAVAIANETVSRTAHTTPLVTVGQSDSVVISYWADRSSYTATWTPPAGEAVRSQTFGVGGGHISTLITDSGASVPAGPRAGLTATADYATPRATMVSLVLAPRG